MIDHNHSPLAAEVYYGPNCFSHALVGRTELLHYFVQDREAFWLYSNNVWCLQEVAAGGTYKWHSVVVTQMM